MYPGETTLTRMFLVAHSTARDEAMWRTAALEASVGAHRVSVMWGRRKQGASRTVRSLGLGDVDACTGHGA